MTDTATAPKTKSERKVEYGELVVTDALPERAQKQSPIKTLLESLKEDTAKHGRWVGIAKYENGSAATAAANVERQRRGQDGTISGWEFATRRTESGTSTILFAKYDPKLVEGTGEERHQRHQTWLEGRKARAAAKKAEKSGAAGSKTSRETDSKSSAKGASAR